MKSGTVIKSRYYATMQANRPFPWIGMPIYYRNIGKWFVVNGVDVSSTDEFARVKDTFAIISYAYDDEPHFILPGEPNAPKMDSFFVDNMDGSYDWGIAVKFSSGMWKRYAGHRSDKTRHEFLYLPYGETIDSMFPNNGNVVEVKDLKKLNTDGRLNCASCDTLLTQCWMGVANLCYCPKCEG